jgi:hypothetical protein
MVGANTMATDNKISVIPVIKNLLIERVEKERGKINEK